jgi:ferritin-like metal-binding protein YciE
MYTESKIRDTFEAFARQLSSLSLIEECRRYRQSAEDKITKLERVFNYLMVSDVSRKCEAASVLIADIQCMIDKASSALLRDILTIGCLQQLNAYKTANYRSACIFAAELELDPVAELLEHIMKWEIKSGSMLTSIVADEFNRIQQAPNKYQL